MPGPSSDIVTRLSARPGAQRLPNARLELVQLRDFLDAETCEALIAMIDENRRRSTLANHGSEIDDFRTSETCDLDTAHPLVARVDAHIADALGISLDRSEAIQGQRYAPGQEFRPHTDTFNPGSADYYLHTADKGQRSWTAMIYLNDVEDGGATRFKAIGKTIQPERGKMVAWNNLTAEGIPNDATLHQGMKVRRGTKYVITKWFRLGA